MKNENTAAKTPIVEAETETTHLNLETLQTIMQDGFKEILKTTTDAMGDLATRLNALETTAAPETDVADTEAVMNAEVKALRQELKQARLRTAKAELQAKYGTEVQDNQVEIFAALPNAEQGSLLSLIDTLKAQAQTVVAPGAPVVKDGVQELEEIGNSAQSAKLSVDQARAQLLTEGVKPAYMYATMLERFPHLAGKI